MSETTPQPEYLTIRIPYPQMLNKHLLVSLLLVILSLVIFLPTLSGEFLYSWDDQRYVTDNHRITDLSPAGLEVIFTEPYFGTYIPITTLSFAVDYKLWEYNPFGYHLTNLLIHTANAVLVYALLFQLLKGANAQMPVTIAAGIGAFLFMLHPVNVEIVAWVSQRKALLGLFFTLLAFLAHIRSSREGASQSWLYAGYILFLLAVLSKAVSVGAPFCFILYDYFWAKKSIRQTAFRNIIPMATGIGGALLGLMTQSDIGAVRPFFGGTIFTHAQLIVVAIWDYTVSLFLPTNFNPLYLYRSETTQPRILATILGSVVLFGSLIWAGYDFWRWFKSKQPPLILMTVTWVWMFFLPVSNIVPMPMTRADRYMYVPVVLLFALVGLGMVKLWKIANDQKPMLIYPLLIVSLIAAGWMLFVTVQHRDVWHSSETLWQDHLRDYPASESGLLNLGVYYFKAADYETALPYFSTLLQDDPTHAKANQFMGNIAFNRGETQTAIRYYQIAAENDDDPYNLYGLGRAYQRLGNNTAALEAYKQAISINPYLREAYPYLGEVALITGDRELALSALQQGIRYYPANAESHSYLCLILGEAGDFDSALTYCQRSIELEENGAYFGRYAHVLILMEAAETALPIAQRAVELAPNDSLGYRTLGDAYRLLGSNQLAAQAYRQALAISPDNTRANEGLALVE